MFAPQIWDIVFTPRFLQRRPLCGLILVHFFWKHVACEIIEVEDGDLLQQLLHCFGF